MRAQGNGHVGQVIEDAGLTTCFPPSSAWFGRPQLRWDINCGDAHRRQAGQQKRRRKALPVHLAVDLVRRLLDAIGCQEPGQVLVAQATFPHFRHQQLLRPVLPRAVRHFRLQFQRQSRCSWLGYRLASRAHFLRLPGFQNLNSVIYDRISILAQAPSYTPAPATRKGE